MKIWSDSELARAHALVDAIIHHPRVRDLLARPRRKEAELPQPSGRAQATREEQATLN